MRTVILNTLGSELRQTSLFYLPFREEQFQWLDADLPHIGQAVEAICANNANQGYVQDYHLVVLVSLTHYGYSRYEWLRALYKDLLFVHINQELVIPLAEQRNLPPTGVSVVYMTPHCSDGTGDVAEAERFDALLGFAGKEEITTLALTTDEGETLDLSRYFADALSDYAAERQAEIHRGIIENKNDSRVNLRESISNILRHLLKCVYKAPGESRPKEIPYELVEFCPKTNNWELFSVDLQMNLSDHLAGALSGTEWNLHLNSHEEKEIQRRISLALLRVEKLRAANDSVMYYSMDPKVDTMGAEALITNIWVALREKTDLPGVKELVDVMGEAFDPENIPKEDSEHSLSRKLSRVWVWLPLAKKRFEQQCEELNAQYDPDTAKKQQKDVLDTCIQFFRDWRVKMISKAQKTEDTPSLQEMPDYDVQTTQEMLAEAQQAYGEVYVEKLEEYEDLREEAEKIKAAFRKDSRLWPGDCAQSTQYFLLYSGVLAILFLLQMMLPFIGITLEVAGEALSGYIHLALSLVVFAGLYAVGVVIWLRVLCERLNQHTQAMYDLLQRTHQRRRQSIIAAVEAYGKRLPECMIRYDRLKKQEQLYAMNLLRKQHFHTHAQILEKAEEVLLEMHTMLQLPVDRTESDKIVLNKKLDYQCAPSHPNNVPLYIFLSEKWGV